MQEERLSKEYKHIFNRLTMARGILAETPSGVAVIRNTTNEVKPEHAYNQRSCRKI